MRDTLSTQRRIVEAAQEEFCATGFEAARIDLIAKRAGVSRQLIYQYFGLKDGLYAAVLDVQAKLVEALFSSVDFEQESVIDALREFVGTVFDFQRSSGANILVDTGRHNASWLRRTATVHGVTKTFVEKVRVLLDRGKEEGLIDPDADAKNFYALCVFVSTGAVSWGSVYSKLLDRDYHSEQAMVFWRQYAADVALRSVLRLEHGTPAGALTPC